MLYSITMIFSRILFDDVFYLIHRFFNGSVSNSVYGNLSVLFVSFSYP